MGLFGNKKNNDSDAVLSSGVGSFKDSNRLKPMKMKRRLAPDAFNPNSLDYFYINDMGMDVFAKSYYIDKLPLNVDFASTFAPLFNTKKVISSVFVNPMSPNESSRLMQNKMRSDETELLEAEQSGISYTIRKMEEKVAENNRNATRLASGKTKWFDVGFLFTITRESLEQLNFACAEFVNTAKERSIELSSCYGMQAEAYLTSGPYNKVFTGKMSLIKSSPVKFWVLDEEAVVTIFNHTNSFFSHPDGIPIGHNRWTGEAVLWNPYAQSHNGFSCAFVGKTGTGKSATIKMFAKRLSYFDYKFGCIDTEKSGGRGEYSTLCDEMGGVNFQLKTNSKNKLNIFEIDVQMEHDAATGIDYTVLKLADKCATVRDIIMSAIIGSKAEPSFELRTSMEAILVRCINDLYNEKGIYDGQPESLYMQGGASGIKKKPLPVMSEAYLWILREQEKNTVAEHVVAFRMLADALSDMVDNLCYDARTYEMCTPEDYELRQMTGRDIRRLNGTKGYFDGQSSVSVSRETPFINIDISDIPDTDKVLGQQVAMNFLMENFIKKNSENDKDAQKICLIVDEAHRLFPNPLSRKFIADQVRTARKNNASIWICTQNHRDFALNDETAGMLKNCTSVFMLKQDASDAQYLRENTILTPSAVNEVLKLGGDPNEIEDKSRKGEICLIDTDKVVFVKVDYLQETEFMFVETDVQKKQQFMAEHGMT